jgi:hypothetical protein
VLRAGRDAALLVYLWCARRLAIIGPLALHGLLLVGAIFAGLIAAVMQQIGLSSSVLSSRARRPWGRGDRLRHFAVKNVVATVDCVARSLRGR